MRPRTIAHPNRFDSRPTAPRSTALRWTTLALAGLLSAGVPAGPLRAQATAEQEQPDAPRPTVRRGGDLVSIFGGDIEIPAHVYQRGMIFCIGGDVDVQGEVGGDVVVVAGSLKVTGKVRDSVAGVLSDVHLQGAEIGNQLVNVAGTLERSASEVRGQVVNIGFGETLPRLGLPFGVVAYLVFWFRVTKILAAFVVILLLCALVPERIRAIGEEVPIRYAPAVFVGLLGYLGLLLALTVLSFTVIGVPLGFFVFLILKWLGMAGIFFALGQRLGRSLGREMSLLGAVLVAFVPYAAIVILPSFMGLPGLILAGILGFFVWFFLEAPGIGLVILTRAGGPPRTALPHSPSVLPLPPELPGSLPSAPPAPPAEREA